jgi:tetratricopeptide (TPR) repeat protein
MREGKEVAGRVLLEKGFEGDPFNIRAYNQLELLDKMDTFTTYRTDHFEIRLEAEKDSALVPLLQKSLDSIYNELVDRHGWKPEVVTIIEVLPSHDWFSARVTGLPWIGGIPAVCFGDVVAMDSPRTLSGRLNWEDVLRHEFGHVLALGMTRRKVPFWFTEGLSVYLEHFPRDRNWDQNLVSAYVDNRLVPLDSLTIAFTRPRHHGQRLLAYHEASIVIRDLVERKGWSVIPDLLLAFGEGKNLDEALRAHAGESFEDLGNRANHVIRAEAASLPVWPAPQRERLAWLMARKDKRKEDVAFLELLSLTQFQFQLLSEADGTAKGLLGLDPQNARAYGILGLGARSGGRLPDAKIHFLRAVELGSTDIPVYISLAEMALAEADTESALSHYGEALEIYPRGSEARTERARLLAAGGNLDAARAEYQTLLRLSADSGEAALELARMELRASRGDAAAEALAYAESVIPLDAELMALRGRAYLLLDRDDEAYALFLESRRLDLRNVESMVGMAQFYMKRKDYEEAAYFAELALKYDPDHAVAREVLLRARAE